MVIKAAFSSLFGDTSGPDVPIFQNLRKNWEQIDPADVELPEIPELYRTDVLTLMGYITTKLLPDNVTLLPRCDYKELLELALMFIGGTVERKHSTYQLQ